MSLNERLKITEAFLSEYPSLEILKEEDLARALQAIPEKLLPSLKTHARLNVSGGLLRSVVSGEKINDVDIFGSNTAALGETASSYLSRLGKSGRRIDTDNAITVLGGALPVQFITVRTYESLVQTLESFDFTIAQAGIEWHDGKWSGLAFQQFYPDLAAKRLRYVRPADNIVGGSLLRVLKFVSRGYYLSPEEYAKILAHFYSDLAHGVEVPYLTTENIARELREVDPLGRGEREARGEQS